MKLVGYDENKRSLTDRALWRKTYNIHVIEEIRQLRGCVSTGMKKQYQRLVLHGTLIFLIYFEPNNCCLYVC